MLASTAEVEDELAGVSLWYNGAGTLYGSPCIAKGPDGPAVSMKLVDHPVVEVFRPNHSGGYVRRADLASKEHHI